MSNKKWALKLAGLCTAVLLLGLLTAYTPRPGLVVLANLIVIVFALAVSFSVAAGIAITASAPPMRKIADISVLGQRVMGFTKFFLACTALLGTTFVGWFINKTFDGVFENNSSFADAWGPILEVLSVPVAAAAMFYWWWLSVDLLRLKRQGRFEALDALSKSVSSHLGSELRPLFSLARWTMSDWWWIVGAFYVFPVFILLLVTIPQFFFPN